VNYESIRQIEFERVAMPHTESLLRAAVRISRDRTAAEDMVQETLMRAWKAFEQFERGTNCKAWLFRIMLNVSNKKYRQALARPVLLQLNEHEPLRVIPLRVKASQLEACEVLSALEALSIEHRLVLILAAVEGFTCKEIAAICSLPIGTVMSRLSRGRTELRKILVYSHREEQRPVSINQG
jgi:RNA polymerase sigma-70 factor, ECF subfamily